MKPRTKTPNIAYFSMEIALDPNMPTYSGGLGMLRRSTLRSAADLGAPVVAVTWSIATDISVSTWICGQSERTAPAMGTRTYPESGGRPVTIEIEQRPVCVRAWQYDVLGVDGDTVAVYLLDTNVPEIPTWDRHLTDSLYGGDEAYRLAQEIVLGLGGLKLLQKLGHDRIQAYHMNEGHSALLALGLLERRLDQSFSGAGQATRHRWHSSHVHLHHPHPGPGGDDHFPSPWSGNCWATNESPCSSRPRLCMTTCSI